jgi:outer membrane protein assembly factor BamB
MRLRAKYAAAVIPLLAAGLVASPLHAAGWPQWAAGPTHESASTATGQALDETFADVVYDPLAPDEMAAVGGDLLVHYQAPLVDGADVFMTFKTGSFTDPEHWQSQVWNIKRLSWSNYQLVEIWSMPSDWKPEPASLSGWEPVFHPALSGDTIYAPGAGGSLLRFRRSDGVDLGRINPFGATLDPQTFVAGPLTIDAAGNVFYNALKVDLVSPFPTDALGAWLVKVTPAGESSMVAFADLVPDAPAANGACELEFPGNDLPWPPAPDAVPPTAVCGSQRPGLNVAPAVDTDGTIYTVSRAHFNDRYGYLIALNPNLAPKWHAALRDRLTDGCNAGLPPNGAPGGCRDGANSGVDPATNRPGAGRVLDLASSSPTVAPDGSILYGTYTRYNYGSGHLLKFSAAGVFLGSYPFGWDLTPSIHRHDGTYSIVLKENHYPGGSYCGNSVYCPDRNDPPATDPEQYFVTQLDAGLTVEWKFKSTNTLSCTRQPDASIHCVDDHPRGFEWCVNAVAVDGNGTTYVNSEDGNLYAISQGGQQATNRFLQLALGAAYTPLSLGADGLIYTQNAGHLFVAGSSRIFGNGFE